MTLPYSKRVDESTEAFEAFACYRDMGSGRSHVAVATELGKSENLIHRWSRKFNWIRRVHAFDAEIDRRKRLVDLREIEKMRRRQTKTALAMQDLGNIELWRLLEQSKSSQRKKGVVEIQHVIKLLEKGATLERLNRGEPSEITHSLSNDALDLTGLSLGELKQLRAIRQKIRARQIAEVEKGTNDE